MTRAAIVCVLSLIPLLSGCAGESAAPGTIPQPGLSAGRSAAGGALSVPTFTSQFEYQRVSYPYVMVGTDPRAGAATTTIPVAIVPVKLTFADGRVLDPTAAAVALPQSPLFTNAQYRAGTTQYGDAVMRSEFWRYLDHGTKPYHVLLAPPTVEPTVSLAVTMGAGYDSTTTVRGVFGYVTFAWFVMSEEPAIIDQLGIPPTELTIFVTSRTDVLEPGNACCFRGYHYDFPVDSAAGKQIWTSAWASITRKNIDALSHEVAEFMNDPYYNNRVLPWISPESGACGGDDLEVGDPVTDYHFFPKGIEVQDVAFFSWFARTRSSIGIDGRWDLMGKLKGPAGVCRSSEPREAPFWHRGTQ